MQLISINSRIRTARSRVNNRLNWRRRGENWRRLRMQRETDQMLNFNLSKKKMNGQQLPDTTNTCSIKELKKESTTRSEFLNRCIKIWRSSARLRRKPRMTIETRMLYIMRRCWDSWTGWSNVKWKKSVSITELEWKRKDKETTNCKRSWTKEEKTKGNKGQLIHL